MTSIEAEPESRPSSRDRKRPRHHSDKLDIANLGRIESVDYFAQNKRSSCAKYDVFVQWEGDAREHVAVSKTYVHVAFGGATDSTNANDESSLRFDFFLML